LLVPWGGTGILAKLCEYIPENMTKPTGYTIGLTSYDKTISHNPTPDLPADKKNDFNSFGSIEQISFPTDASRPSSKKLSPRDAIIRRSTEVRSSMIPKNSFFNPKVGDAPKLYFEPT
jgi:hypothetical protein